MLEATLGLFGPVLGHIPEFQALMKTSRSPLTPLNPCRNPRTTAPCLPPPEQFHEQLGDRRQQRRSEPGRALANGSQRQRRGEKPTLNEYCQKYPHLADDIRDVFPVLIQMEHLRSDGPDDSTGDVAVHTATRLERLGDYRILREVGRGGMGVVYEAEQESLGRRVALKVLPDAALADAQQVLRFQREARAAARLHHTNIVPVFGVGRDDGHHYYVMQFIPGMGLDAVLEELRRLRRGAGSASPPADRGRSNGAVSARGSRRSDPHRAVLARRTGRRTTRPGTTLAASASAPLVRPAARSPGPAGSSVISLPGASADSLARSDPDRTFFRSVARIGLQVAEALEYANRQGVLHRDVKPSNLLLDPKGNVWVADFGLAKAADAEDITHSGDIVGTVRYMAPERFAGKCDAPIGRLRAGPDALRVAGLAAGLRGVGPP